MNPRDAYAFAAAALLVLLGLGLIYLAVMDRISAGVAVASLFLGAAIVPILAMLRDAGRDGRDRGGRRRHRAERSGGHP